MKMTLTKKIVVGLIFGILVGLALNIFAPSLFNPLDTYLFQPLGQIFLNLITMLVVPIVFISITLGVVGLGDTKKLGSIGLKTVTFFLVTTCMAIIIGLTLALVFEPGNAGNFENMMVDELTGDQKQEEAPPIMDTLLNIIPTNPVQAMAEGEMLQVIFFAILLGFAMNVLGEKVNGIKSLLEQANDVIMLLVNLAIKTAPYGAFGLIASAVGGLGINAVKAMGAYFGVVLLALAIHFFIVYGAAIFFMAKTNPILFFKRFFPAISVAFSTSSSNATLPVSMDVAQENLGIPKKISSFIQPLGATINMDGTAIMQGVATIFIAQVYGVELSLMQLLTIVGLAVIASIGTAGVPGVGFILLAMVLQQVGLPVEGIALILGIDRILDMTRTSVNITGDAVCAMIVAKSEDGEVKIPEEAKM
ncbi:Proton/glutamate-aspartate symporter [Sutcliffiella rhizosphaerae]|uniref:Proton/glutamate-aspartate symporter n=2 Tax=Sutcliffiella rhizosphaerae TaxID=2880967 RepID=A0ABN8ACF0_9BACI|nr:Proton/glutamate-aspartate symporter [Sutcliffiella rhizosphaerae]